MEINGQVVTRSTAAMITADTPITVLTTFKDLVEILKCRYLKQLQEVQLLEFLPVVNGGTIDTFDIESNHKWVLAGSNTSGEIYYVGFRVTTNGVSVAVSVSKSGVWKGFSTFTEDVFDKPPVRCSNISFLHRYRIRDLYRQ